MDRPELFEVALHCAALLLELANPLGTGVAELWVRFDALVPAVEAARELVAFALERAALTRALLPKDAFVFDELAKDFEAALFGEYLLRDVVDDGGVERIDRDAVANARFLAAATEPPAVVVTLRLAAWVELAGALELTRVRRGDPSRSGRSAPKAPR